MPRGGTAPNPIPWGVVAAVIFIFAIVTCPLYMPGCEEKPKPLEILRVNIHRPDGTMTCFKYEDYNISLKDDGYVEIKPKFLYQKGEENKIVIIPPEYYTRIDYWIEEGEE